MAKGKVLGRRDISFAEANSLRMIIGITYSHNEGKEMIKRLEEAKNDLEKNVNRFQEIIDRHKEETDREIENLNREVGNQLKDLNEDKTRLELLKKQREEFWSHQTEMLNNHEK